MSEWMPITKWLPIYLSPQHAWPPLVAEEGSPTQLEQQQQPAQGPVVSEEAHVQEDEASTSPTGRQFAVSPGALDDQPGRSNASGPAVPVTTVQQRLVADLLAGCTLATVLVPQSMAYAILGDFPAVQGLYCAFFCAILYTIFGTSRIVDVGTSLFCDSVYIIMPNG